MKLFPFSQSWMAMIWLESAGRGIAKSSGLLLSSSKLSHIWLSSSQTNLPSIIDLITLFFARPAFLNLMSDHITALEKLNMLIAAVLITDERESLAILSETVFKTTSTSISSLSKSIWVSKSSQFKPNSWWKNSKIEIFKNGGSSLPLIE